MKKGKHFYSHLIDTTAIILELTDMDMSSKERLHLIALVESNLHHVIIDVILSHLKDGDKKEFLLHLSLDNHDEIWKLLNSKIEKVEEKIKKAAEDLKKELHEDIKDL